MFPNLLTFGAFVRDPIPWLVAGAAGVTGLALPDLSSSHGLIIGLLALLGGFFGKGLEVFLKYRQQNNEASESLGARFERLLNQEREDHFRTEERYLKRIQDLEDQLDDRRRKPRIDP